PLIYTSLLVAFTSGYVIYQIFLSPLASVPGPLLAKITTWYQAYLSMRGNVHRDLVELHNKYGSVVRMGPNTLWVSNEASGRFKKASTYNVLKGSRPFDIVGKRDERIHGEQRRLVARAYSMDSTVYLEPKVDEILLQSLDQLAKTSGFTDLGAWIQLFAFGHSDTKDIMSQLFTTQQTKPKLNDMNIAFMLSSNVFAGSDTTSSALRGILYLLLKNPQYYDQLVKEAEGKFAEGKLSDSILLSLVQALGPFIDHVKFGEQMLKSFGQKDSWAPGPVNRVSSTPYETPLQVANTVLERYFFGFGGGSRTCLGRSMYLLAFAARTLY
ncbi:cytochrome P450, partial [Penicillium malachiteum]|uniref:cytochrome P450 n=1 Tax=Penicillium malachiteum TaxID=1324776 RepID=UPI002547C49D